VEAGVWLGECLADMSVFAKISEELESSENVFVVAQAS
jgi:hypothetical protein